MNKRSCESGNSICAITVLLAGILLFCVPDSSTAALWVDPKPPMTWNETLECELVITGKYHSHGNGQLTLDVLAVLKGDAVRAGDMLQIGLKHLYSIEAGRVGWDTWPPNAKPDGIPKLCYKQQLMNPGDLHPVKMIPDVREATVYFFALAKSPDLVKRGQVQPVELARGWRQALKRRPMNLTFRIVQNVNRKLARDALEELAKNRNAACIEQLFQWVLSPFEYGLMYTAPVQHFLATIGDHDGDVYDRAHELLTDEADGTAKHRFNALAGIMAQVAPERALNDFRDLIERNKAPEAARAAAWALGSIPTRQAFDYALGLLPSPTWGEAGAAAIGNMFRANGRRRYKAVELFEYGVPLLREAIKDRRLSEPVQRELHWVDELRKEPRIDLARLRQLVLDPDAYGTLADSEFHNLLEQAKRSADPRVVPVLVEALATVPEARGTQSYGLSEAIAYFAHLAPNLMRQEFQNHDLDKLIGPRDYQVSAQFKEVFVTIGLRPKKSEPLEAAVSGCRRVALSVRQGGQPVDDLLKEVDVAVHRWSEPYMQRGPILTLLVARNPRADRAFFGYLDTFKKWETTKFDNSPRLSIYYSLLLYFAFDERPDVFFDCLLPLLKSDSLAKRKVAVEALEWTLRWDCDFDAAAFKAQRRERLTTIEPMIAQLSRMEVVDIRAAIMGKFGAKLPATTWRANWLPRLKRFAVSYNPAIAENALLLIGEITGERGCFKLASYPVPQRRRALALFLDDRTLGPR